MDVYTDCGTSRITLSINELLLVDMFADFKIDPGEELPMPG